MSYNPLDPAVTSNPYPYYAQLRANEPVKWLDIMQGFAISRWDDVEAVLSDSKTFSSAQFWPALLGEYDPVPEVQPMISLDPPGHVRIRKLANKAFVPSRVGALSDRIRSVTHELIDDIFAKHGGEGEFDFVWEFSGLFPVSVIAEVLGVDIARRVDFKNWVDDLLAAGNRAAYGPERLAEIDKSSQAIRAYFEQVYDERSANPGDDLISGFIQAEVNGERLTRSEVLNMAILLLIGGVETTTNLLGITFAHLKTHPDIAAAIWADPTRIPALLEEMLRFDGPVQMLFRHTTCDTELAGIAVPKGSLVLPLLGSANHDERKFDRSEELVLDRNPKEIMSFGQGPHFCLGSYLSRMEAKSALEILTARFESIEAIGDTVKWSDSYFARGPKSLPVRFKAR
ncbi:cytochrome P450 [Sphingobium cupriresistens]|uniref:Cytochrome P450 n=1 Tax=Sphingobium cupriresistens LL01 TaxID=1420583 RepID=A0A0J7Y301_9SPHN|nr:cytochrome P450 [Sphingobium cupriresistens]KMS58179.1 cytochrome P450 [Sphingobium cupriresistens LL01]